MLKQNWFEALLVSQVGRGVTPFEDERVSGAVDTWMARTLPKRPRCLLCDHRFVSRPKFFLVLTKDESEEWRRCIVSGICEECIKRPHLMQLCSEQLGQLRPGSYIQPVHAEPACMQ
jgi:hypothetical protein